ncbi:MAG: OmpA family protein [Muribaculaceae bacterium]|nr:OmpA family protein [Muribaculaceae bacterium]
MEKTDQNKPRSGEGCAVFNDSTPEQKYIENHEHLLIEDKGEIEEPSFVDGPEPVRKKNWFGWWACALLAIAVIGLCLYFATDDSQPRPSASALASGNSAFVSASDSVGQNGRKAVNKKVVMLKKVIVRGNADDTTAGVTAAGSGVSDSANAGVLASEASIDKAANLEASVDYIYYFGNDQSAVSDNTLLDEIAQKASETGADITVTAYASETGSAAYNKELTKERATNLADYLISRGVPADHIKISAGGQTDRYGDYALNRRADIVVDYAG